MGILSTVSDNGTPWGSAIYYIADEDFNFYFVTRAETLKFQNIDSTALAALTVADNDSQTTVQLTGKISTVPVQQYMDVFFTKFVGLRPKDDFTWVPPVEKLKAGNYMPLQLTPTTLQYADYKHLKADMHADYIEKIIG
jgi:uncharacterized protein YhbP (UPF0306 family)